MATSFIHAQLKALSSAGTIITPNRIVKFDTVVTNSDDCSLNYNVGNFKLETPGAYLINWTIHKKEQGTGVYAIAVTTGDGAGVYGDEVAYGFEIGSAVVVIDQPSVVTLLNDGPKNITYDTIFPIANITIVQMG